MAYILINIPGISPDTADTIVVQYEWQVYSAVPGSIGNGASYMILDVGLLGTVITQTIIDQCVAEANAGGNIITELDRKIILNCLN